VILRVALGVLIGAAVGAILGHFGKCSTGSCPLTANPARGAVWGAVLGLLFSMALPHRPVAPSADSEKVKQIRSEAEFESRVLASNGLCLVDFFADWCPPCHVLSPTMSALADRYAGKVFICKVDVEKLESLARKYQVSGIPKVLLFENGRRVEQADGVRSERFYRRWIDSRLPEDGDKNG